MSRAAPTDPPSRDLFERDVRARCEAGAWREAAALVIEGYGPELMGLLVALASPKSDADDQFSELCLDVLGGLPSFRWQSTLRTWVYAIARHRVLNARRAPAARLPHLPLSGAPELDAAAARVRTTTAPWLRSEVKDQFAAIRAQLSQDEQLLLILRVDRNLSWQEVGEVQGESPAALRKRFERLKTRLAAMARAQSGNFEES